MPPSSKVHPVFFQHLIPLEKDVTVLFNLEPCLLSLHPYGVEDFELVRRLRRRSAPAVVRAPVVTSARRWDAFGLLQVTLINQAIVLGYNCGVPVDTLAKWYKLGKRALPNAQPKRVEQEGETQVA